MGKRIDITNKRYGKLLVISYAGCNKWGATWRCRCDCGTEKVMDGSALRANKLKSCGCSMHEGKRIDMTGQRVGRLTVIEYAGSVRRATGCGATWRCICDCGKECIRGGGALRQGATFSCGCRVREATTTHGQSRTNVYFAWKNMIRRCYDTGVDSYARYGGRGIAVCPRWRKSFENFIADMGPRPTPKHTIERNDNDGNYEPKNCRWATRVEQAVNKRSTIRLTYKGRTKCLVEWARVMGLTRSCLRYRLARGWSIERALTTPRTR